VAERAGMPLIIAGIIQDDDYFDRLVKPHVDGEGVNYIGAVGPEARSGLLGGARALLHLIDFEEPFGFSVVEAMACGTPVITHRRGSMPEIIHERKNGFLVDSIDAAVEAVPLAAALDRREVRESVKQRFDAARMVDDYLSVYRRIVGSIPRSGD